MLHNPAQMAVWHYYAWKVTETHCEMPFSTIAGRMGRLGHRPPDMESIMNYLVDNRLVEIRLAHMGGQTHVWYRKALNSHMDKPPELQAWSVPCAVCGRPICRQSGLTKRDRRRVAAHDTLLTCSLTCSENPRIKRLREVRRGLMRAKIKLSEPARPVSDRQIAIAEIVGKGEMRRLGLKTADL